jgi:hypothetical protein
VNPLKIQGIGMGRNETEALVVLMSKLSPHLDKASATLARLPFFKKRRVELEPEERLAVYLRLRAMRRKMGLPERMDGETEENGAMAGDSDEGTIIRGDADIDSGCACGGGDSRHTDDGHRKGDAEKHWGADEKDRPDGKRVDEV